MSREGEKQLLILAEDESCPESLLEHLKNEGFETVVHRVNQRRTLSDNLTSAEKQAGKMCGAGYRRGILGIGYGGAVAGHLLAEFDDFQAAVLIGALTNPATAYGTGTGVRFPGTGENFCMLEYLSKLSDESVVRHCDAIHTPILFLHGLKDTRYGFEQSEQLFTALKERQPESELRMVVFPEAGHELLGSPYGARCEKEITGWLAANMCGGNFCE